MQTEDQALTDDLRQEIETVLRENPWTLFMKGTPDQPLCGFSARVVAALQDVGVPFVGVNILDSDHIRQGMKDYSNWPTFPQLYHRGELLGGCDIIMELHRDGELRKLAEGSA